MKRRWGPITVKCLSQGRTVGRAEVRIQAAQLQHLFPVWQSREPGCSPKREGGEGQETAPWKYPLLVRLTGQIWALGIFSVSHSTYSLISSVLLVQNDKHQLTSDGKRPNTWFLGEHLRSIARIKNIEGNLGIL